MKKRILVVCSIFVLVVLIYLNRSYAHIYQYITVIDLKAPSTEITHYVGKINSSPITYVAIGDSLTAGVGVDSYTKTYPYIFADKISKEGRYVELKNMGVPGSKSSEMLLLIDSIIQLQPDIITILIGVNDVHGNISKKLFRQNYENILKRLHTETDAKIYVINIPYIGSEKLIRQPYRYYFDYRTRGFNKIIKEVSSTFSLNTIDLYSQTLQNSQQEDYYSVDLFHPSDAGYTDWSQILYDHLNQ